MKTLSGIKVYPLAKADNPPQTRVVMSGGRPMDSIAPKGVEYWEMLAWVLGKETVEDRDGSSTPCSSRSASSEGSPSPPDARQRKILADAAQVGFLMSQSLSMAPRLSNASSYPGTHWEWVLTLDPSQESTNYSQLDERTDYTFEAITIADGMVKPIVGAGSQYMSAAKDKTGAWLDGGKSYTLRVPANVPAKEFWAVTVYDVLTRSMVKTDTMKAGVSSQDKLLSNKDGSVDVHFGPTASKDGGNWVKTIPGRGWFAYFRWYGPTENFFNKSWTLPDIERRG